MYYVMGPPYGGNYLVIDWAVKHYHWKTKHSSREVVWNECAATASLELAYAVWQVVQCLQKQTK